MTQADLDTRLYEAFVYGFPLYEVACTRTCDATGTDGQPPLPANVLRHDRTLTRPTDRWVTTPNNDTLYSRAWLDLSGGPVRVTVGPLPEDRYWSIAFMDATTRNFSMLGQRLHGAGNVTVTLVGPSGSASGADGEVIMAPGNDVWLFGRWLVTGEHDVHIAHGMQDSMSITAFGSTSPPAAMPGPSDGPAEFLAVVAEQLRRNPPPTSDRTRLERLEAVGVGASNVEPWKALDEETQEAWTRLFRPFHDRLREAILKRRLRVGQWMALPKSSVSPAEADELRASIALGGLGALDADEAVYAACLTDENGIALEGRHSYRLTVPPEGIPARSFWSLTMYSLEPDGRKFLVPNSIGRHSIGDRTQGLKPEPDGTLSVVIQQQEPATPPDRANWLPAPAGPFQVTLRAYAPSSALMSWEVPLPRLERIGSSN